MSNTPLGFAVMSLRGATADLSDALSVGKPQTILTCNQRLRAALSRYYESKNSAPMRSLVTGTLLAVGDDSTKAAEAMLQTVAWSLRSSFELVSGTDDSTLA